MDVPAILGGAAVTAVAVTAVLLEYATPEPLLAVLLAAGAVTGAASRTFQSEFLDAFFAGTIGFAAAVVVLAVGFDGVRAANAILGIGYNFGLLVALFGVAASPLAGLVAAVGGGLGVRVRGAVSERGRKA